MPSLHNVSAGVYRLEGDVGLTDITALSASVLTPDSGVLTLDFAGLGEADSSVAALLLQWARQAQGGGACLRLENCPAKVAELLHLYDLDQVFPVS